MSHPYRPHEMDRSTGHLLHSLVLFFAPAMSNQSFSTFYCTLTFLMIKDDDIVGYIFEIFLQLDISLLIVCECLYSLVM